MRPASIPESRSNFSINVSNVSEVLNGEVKLAPTSLHARAGDVIALVGPNGVGKTLFAGIVGAMGGIKGPPTEGIVEWNGVDIYGELSSADRALLRSQELGWVSQEPGKTLRPRLTVQQTMMLRANNAKTKVSKRDIARLLDVYDLGYLTEVRTGPLSGGQKQLIAMARAEIVAPSLYILDEPTAALDKNITAFVHQRIDYLAQTGAVVLVITHDQLPPNALVHEFTKPSNLTVASRA